MSKIILATQSPRRRFLFAQLGFEFEFQSPDIDEVFPDDLPAEAVAEFLAVLKSHGLKASPQDLVITCDTTVVLDGQVINKPSNREDAIQMLLRLSGRKHVVVSGVCLMWNGVRESFSVKTNVYFHELKREDIAQYVDTFLPLDKAGSYGVQEWIGYVGVEKIEGDYYNVMGLPLQALYPRILAKGFVPDLKIIRKTDI